MFDLFGDAAELAGDFTVARNLGVFAKCLEKNLRKRLKL
jgi:hypothetical protein